MRERFWQDDPDAPFARLLEIIEAHGHPEAWEDGYEALQRLAKRHDDPETDQFKAPSDRCRASPGTTARGGLGYGGCI